MRAGPLDARISEEDCLDEVMRLTFGDAPCPACERQAGFERARKHRAFVCRGCGFSVYPCQGTPFETPVPPLRHWFAALDRAAAGGRITAGSLARTLGASRRDAAAMAAAIAAMRNVTSRDVGSPAIPPSCGEGRVAPQARTGVGIVQKARPASHPAPPPPGSASPSPPSPQGGGIAGSAQGRGGAIDWIGSVAAFVRCRLAEAGAPAAPDGAHAVAAERPETVWETLRDAVALPDFERRPLLGILVILTLAVAGAGIGWLLVPAPPEEDAEMAQATAILTLAYDKPVIIVTPEVAAQLYNVSDVDGDADSPLATSIRVAPSPAAQKETGGLTEAKPMAQPAVRLAAGIGKSLAQGDVSGAKAKAGQRPELAAYNSLAQEMEAKGPRNPDELLTFGPIRIRRHLVDKIRRAASVTEMDPVLLMAIADKESSFQTEVQAQTSSASGLFQFIERTWLGVVRDYGARHGLAAEARLVAGELAAADRTKILDLRRDPYLSSVLAAEMLKRDSERIARRLGRGLTGGEIYLVHFLGPDGAERLLDQVGKKPETAAADLLPKPAAANRPIFYGRDGEGGTKTLSVAEVHGKFETMISLRLDRYRSVKAAPAAARRP